MSKKISAVEWLKEIYNSCNTYEKFIANTDWEQAKAMEKEQIIDALQEFLDITLPNEVCEQYYNETFKSE